MGLFINGCSRHITCSSCPSYCPLSEPTSASALGIRVTHVGIAVGAGLSGGCRCLGGMRALALVSKSRCLRLRLGGRGGQLAGSPRAPPPVDACDKPALSNFN